MEKITNRKDMTSTLHHAIDTYYSNELNNKLLNDYTMKIIY